MMHAFVAPDGDRRSDQVDGVRLETANDGWTLWSCKTKRPVMHGTSLAWINDCAKDYASKSGPCVVVPGTRSPWLLSLVPA